MAKLRQPSSKLYEGPFEIEPKTRVNAIAVVDGKTILSMRETFGPSNGLYWAKPGEKTEGPKVAPPITALQAEDAETKNGFPNSVGQTGFVTFKQKEGSLTFSQEHDGVAGEVTLLIKYTHWHKRNECAVDLYWNDKLLTTLSFPSTGSWNDNWQILRVPVRLEKGSNKISFRSTGNSLPNFDEISFE